jgi:aspartokinase-like uncharacterized kinase
MCPVLTSDSLSTETTGRRKRMPKTINGKKLEGIKEQDSKKKMLKEIE